MHSYHCLLISWGHLCKSGIVALVCVFMQATSAASERSFSKAGLIVAAKRMVMTPWNMDDLHLVGWRMAESGWTNQRKEERTKHHRRKKRKQRKKQQCEQGRAS